MSLRTKRTIIAPEAPKAEDRRFDQEPEPEESQDSPEHKRAIERGEERKTLISISDQLAGDTEYFRIHKWPLADEVFPEHVDADMRFVTKFYPYAKDGKQLYVLEPRTQAEAVRAFKIQDIMRHHTKLKPLKLRVVVIEPDATIDKVREQLGEE